MVSSMPARGVSSHYVDAFKAHTDVHGGPAWLVALRQRAFEKLCLDGFPGRKDEDWIYTDVRALTSTAFAPAEAPSTALPLPKRAFATRLVFVDGVLDLQRSDIERLAQGLHCTPIDALDTAQVAGLEHSVDYEQGAFALLNTAFLGRGLVLRVAPGARVEQPIEILYLASGGANPQLCQPRVQVQVGEGAHVSLVERYLAHAPGAYFRNAVCDVRLDQGAHLSHVKVQCEAEQAWHLGHMTVQQGTESSFDSTHVTVGARLARTELTSVLDAAGARCDLRGVYLSRQTQVHDQHTVVVHAHADCESSQLFKGVLNDRARGVFTGRVVVRQDAQRTNAQQQNRNLLLSDSAIANTRPQLEIYADDVSCSHGATVGQLDAEALFYLRTRGIDRDQARALLGLAFAHEVVAAIPFESLRSSVLDLVTTWFSEHAG